MRENIFELDGGHHEKEEVLPRNKNIKAAAKQAKSKHHQNLVQFFAQSPLAEANLALERAPDYGRELNLFSGPAAPTRGTR